jgi:hypothetical protein
LAEDWLLAVLAGENPPEIDLSCGETPNTLQLVVEKWGEKLIESGIRSLMRGFQIDVVFELLSWVDNTAEWKVDGSVSITVFGRTLRSPEFSVVLRAVSDGGEWAVCSLTDALD